MNNPEMTPITEREHWQMALKKAAQNPIDEAVYHTALTQNTPFSEVGIQISDLNIDKTRLFLFDASLAAVQARATFPLVKSENNNIPNDVQGNTGNTVFDKEFARLRVASNILHAKFNDFQINLAFTIGPEGFGIELGHITPEKINPVTKLYITLAPNKLSESDRLDFYSQLKQHKEAVQSQNGAFIELIRHYELKSGLKFDPTELVEK